MGPGCEALKRRELTEFPVVDFWGGGVGWGGGGGGAVVCGESGADLDFCRAVSLGLSGVPYQTGSHAMG